MAFWNYFPRYVSVGEKKARAAKKLEALKKKQDVQPVIIHGNAIARTWWGKAWIQNLERYADYSNRIGRGRSYVRHGSVLDLRIGEGEINSLVQGSRAKPYTVVIKIKKLNSKSWRDITTRCSGALESLPELLAGSFPEALGEIFMQRDSGLFPSPNEISFECSCPDWARMCKHVAASLYGVGARFDEDPLLFFTLRGVNASELISRTVKKKAESMLDKASQKSSRIIDSSDLSSMFGIEFADGFASPAGEKSGIARKKKVKRVKRTSAAPKQSDAAEPSGKQTASGKTAVRKAAASSLRASAKVRGQKKERRKK